MNRNKEEDWQSGNRVPFQSVWKPLFGPLDVTKKLGTGETAKRGTSCVKILMQVKVVFFCIFSRPKNKFSYKSENTLSYIYLILGGHKDQQFNCLCFYITSNQV